MFLKFKLGKGTNFKLDHIWSPFKWNENFRKDAYKSHINT